MSQEVGKEPALRSLSWYKVWLVAITKPAVGTFERIIGNSNTYTLKAVFWVIISTFLPFAMTLLLRSQQEIAATGVSSTDTSVRVVFGLSAIYTGGMLGELLIALLGIHFFAKFSSGNGSYSKLFYATAAYLSPITIISFVLNMLPYRDVSLTLLAIYAIVLSFFVTKAVYRLEWILSIVFTVLWQLLIWVVRIQYLVV